MPPAITAYHSLLSAQQITREQLGFVDPGSAPRECSWRSCSVERPCPKAHWRALVPCNEQERDDCRPEESLRHKVSWETSKTHLRDNCRPEESRRHKEGILGNFQDRPKRLWQIKWFAGVILGQKKKKIGDALRNFEQAVAFYIILTCFILSLTRVGY